MSASARQKDDGSIVVYCEECKTEVPTNISVAKGARNTNFHGMTIVDQEGHNLVWSLHLP
jgi:hypothetical protein